MVGGIDTRRAANKEPEKSEIPPRPSFPRAKSALFHPQWQTGRTKESSDAPIGNQRAPATDACE